MTPTCAHHMHLVPWESVKVLSVTIRHERQYNGVSALMSLSDTPLIRMRSYIMFQINYVLLLTWASQLYYERQGQPYPQRPYHYSMLSLLWSSGLWRSAVLYVVTRVRKNVQPPSSGLRHFDPWRLRRHVTRNNPEDHNRYLHRRWEPHTSERCVYIIFFKSTLFWKKHERLLY
jgi:hypothetical protein